MELYPGLKPLPKPKVSRPVAQIPKGMVTKATYERRKFEGAFKKA